MITLAYIREALAYDDERGQLIWRRDRPSHHFADARGLKHYQARDAGNIAGGLWSCGYIGLTVGGRRILAHRVIYAMNHSIEIDDLPHRIDHQDTDTMNNRIGNLREATHNENMHNRGMNSNNTSGFKGVSFKKQNNKWVANIKLNGVKKHLGYFDTPEEASSARLRAANDLHGKFARHAVRAA